MCGTCNDWARVIGCVPLTWQLQNFPSSQQPHLPCLQAKQYELNTITHVCNLVRILHVYYISSERLVVMNLQPVTFQNLRCAPILVCTEHSFLMTCQDTNCTPSTGKIFTVLYRSMSPSRPVIVASKRSIQMRLQVQSRTYSDKRLRWGFYSVRLSSTSENKEWDLNNRRVLDPSCIVLETLCYDSTK